MATNPNPQAQQPSQGPFAGLAGRVMAAVAPRFALARWRARQTLEHAQRAYEGASRADGWRPKRSGASANADHMADGAELRARARALWQNVPYVRSALDARTAYRIGNGIEPRSLAKDAAQKTAVWREWSKVADADGHQTAQALIRMADAAQDRDGEVLIRRRWRRLGDGLPVPMQLQVLEIDWLDSSRTGTNGGNSIIQGIEYSPIGRVVAYWLWDQHPGEISTTSRRAASYPVPAADIIHYYAKQRPGQGRGISVLAPVIARVRDVALLEDAHLARKNLEQRLGVVATFDPSGLNPGGPEQAAQTGQLGAMPSGSITSIPQGDGALQFIDPTVTPGFVDDMVYHQQLVAAALGVPYESMTGNVDKTTFVSARVRRLDFKRQVDADQWHHIIPNLVEPIWRWFVEAGVLAGQFGPDASADYSTPKWEYVNPKDDVAADVAEIHGGLATFSEKLRQRNYDPAQVYAELAKDIQTLEASGVLAVLMQLQTGKLAQADAAPAAPAGRAARGEDGAAQENSASAMVLQAALDLVRRAQDNAQAQASAVATQGQQPIHVHLPAPNPTPVEVRSEITVPTQPAPVVEVRNEITVPQAAAPNVEVRAELVCPEPVVHLEMPPLQVEVTARMPERTTVTELVSDPATGKPLRSISVARDKADQTESR